MNKLFFAAALALPLAACGGSDDAAKDAQVAAAEAKLAAAEAKLAAQTGTPPASPSISAQPATAATAPGSASAAAAPGGKIAQCRVWSPGGEYSGKCKFTPRGRGSFTIAPIEARTFVDDLSEVMVDLTSDTAGRLGGKRYGEVERFGYVERDPQDKACWHSEDFSVCAN